MYDDDAPQSACDGLDPNLFFDNYEDSVLGDKSLARMVDKTYCFQCPRLQACLEEGIRTKSSGVWGGVYLDEGKVSRKFNQHKSSKDWQKIAEKIK